MTDKAVEPACFKFIRRLLLREQYIDAAEVEEIFPDANAHDEQGRQQENYCSYT